MAFNVFNPACFVNLVYIFIQNKNTQIPVVYSYIAHFLRGGGDRRVRIFSAYNNWWATQEVSLPLPYQRSANVFLNFLQQGVKTMYYFKNMYSKSLKCAK